MSKDNQEGFSKMSINWYPGHMAKTKREIKEKLDLIDIVFEIIDARIPKSSKNNDVDSLIKNKPRVLIMTKLDLCDEVETKKWIKYYEEKGYKVIALDLINHPNLNLIYNETSKLQNELNKKRQEKGLKEKINNLDYDIIISSPLLRAKHTAKIVNMKNKDIIVDNKLKERDPGSLSGQPLEITNREEYWNYYLTTEYGTSENIKLFFERIYKFLDELKVKDYKSVL